MELNVTQFRSQCLALLEDIPEEGIVITKRGKPLALLTPFNRRRRKGKTLTSALILGKGELGPALGDGLTTPWELVFDEPVFD